MGLGGAKFRTWSGPGGSSHKGPLTSALAYWDTLLCNGGLFLEFIQFILGLLQDPRGAIAGWIISLGPVWVYTPLFSLCL